MGFVVMGSVVAVGLLVCLLAPCCSVDIPTTNTTRSFKSELLVMKSDRLPTHVLPTHYKIQLIPFLWEGNFTTAGEVVISLNCSAVGSNITVNLKDVMVDEGSVRVWDMTPGEEEEELTVTGHQYDMAAQSYSVLISEDLVPGRQYRVRVSFVGQLNDLLQGFYRSSYVDGATGDRRWLASTQFSPTDARRAFPCLDEPAFKARFSVSVARRRNMTSLSNMPLRVSLSIPNMEGWVWDHYHETLPMSTYLVAVMVSDLQGRNATYGVSQSSPLGPHLQFRVWSRKDALPQTRYAGNIGPRILRYLEGYFDVPFPLPKQDLVALPDFGFNAMENWGLVTFRESAMLYDPKLSTESNKRKVATVLSHEMVHQWFGNLVTPHWWNDLWLKEGFATFIGNRGVVHVEPSWRMDEQFVKDTVQTSAFALDALESSHAISVTVDHTDQIRQIFDDITYDKGAALIRMMSHFLGEDTFRAGLTLYLQEHQFGNARQDDLWRSLTTQAHQDGSLPRHITVGQIMDTWTLQIGYPVISVTRDYIGRHATISQNRFLLFNGNDSRIDSSWWVPLTYTTQIAPNFNLTRPQLWLENTASTNLTDLPGPEHWVVFNIQQTGYYRVNYDPDNWRLLTQHFQALPILTRSQLLEDAFALSRSGLLDYSRSLDLMMGLAAEEDYLPWGSALGQIEYLDNQLARTPAYGSLKDLLLRLLGRLYTSLGFEERPADSHLELLNRAQILTWSCDLGHEMCVWHAMAKFREWMTQKNAPNPISPNQKAVVYCTAIRHGGKEEWTFAWKKYSESNVGSDRETLLDALGCTREPWLLSRYLSWIVSNSSGIRKQDGARVFSSVAKNIVGHDLAFNFLREYWGQLQEYYGVAFSSISKMVAATRTFMNTAAQLKQLEELRDTNSGCLGSTARSFEQTLEKVRANVAWMSRNYEDVADWISSQRL